MSNIKDFWKEVNKTDIPEEYRILVKTLSSYSGIQSVAFHMTNIQKPEKNIPKSILLATVIIEKPTPLTKKSEDNESAKASQSLYIKIKSSLILLDTTKTLIKKHL